jgi:CHAT domain-containing protein/Tfp pilus assembly protein PilF
MAMAGRPNMRLERRCHMKKVRKFPKLYLVALIGCVLCCQAAAGRTPPWRSVQSAETEAAQLRKRAEEAQKAGRYDEALALALRAMALDEKERGPNHPDLASSALLVAEIYMDRGDNAMAEEPLDRALSIRERALGPEHPDVAVVLNDLALLCVNKGEGWRAEPFYQRALGIRERALGPEHPDVALSLNNLAVLYDRRGEFWKADPLYQRALAIREKALGPEHPHVALSLSNLAGLYDKMDNSAKAERLYLRALAIREKTMRPDHPHIASLLNSLAILYDDRGEYGLAEPLYRRALAIREKALPPNHRDRVLSYENLALLLVKKKDYEGAAALYRRGLERGDSLPSQIPAKVAEWLNILAFAYSVINDSARVEALYQLSISIQEKAYGQKSLGVTGSLGLMGSFYLRKGDYAKAEACYSRVMAVWEKAPGGERWLPGTLNSLASIAVRTGDFAKAESLYSRSLSLSEKAPVQKNYVLLETLVRLAEMRFRSGKYAEAEALYQRSLDLGEKAEVNNSSYVNAALRGMAFLHLAKGDTPRAISLFTRIAEESERRVTKSLGSGSERYKLREMQKVAADIDPILSLHAQYAPDNPDAWRLALTTILRYKGRALDAMTDTLKAMRAVAEPQDQAMLDQLAEARARLATASLESQDETAPAERRALLKRLEGRIEQLESEISDRVAAFRTQALPTQLFAYVAQAIPPGAALVEFTTYQPYNFKTRRRAPPRYLAYTLTPEGKSLWLDLGETGLIDRAIDELRAALRDPQRTDVKELARALDAKLMEPVRRMHSARWLLISPDGQLNLVPFGALVDEQGHYLIENYLLTYLTSGRDLLRMSMRVSSRRPPLIIANPDFGEQPQPEAQKKQSYAFGDFYFKPLPGTGAEGEALRAILPDATVLTERQAKKGAIVAAAGPEILHIATHGFFLTDLKVPTPDLGNLGTIEVMRDIGLLAKKGPGAADPLKEQPVENPLLRSGLALAGANEYWRDGNEGILTAMETTGLYLWGTKLVVLSACDTGVGQIKNGDGVYGLRRALVLAGSESQVMSLWPVSDLATRALMVDFYQALRRGEGRSEALRNAQLNLLRDPKRSHPAYWASFIQSGLWTSLNEGRPSAR